MFINFLNGKSRTFTGEELLDVFDKEYVETLNKNHIKTHKSPFVLFSKEDDDEVYGIGLPNRSGNNWAMIIDDSKKVLIVNTRKILGDFNTFYNTRENVKCTDSLGEYQIIDALSVLDDIDKLRLELERIHILYNEQKLWEECNKLIAKGNYPLVSAKQNNVKSKYLDCYYEGCTPQIPNILYREQLKENEFSNLNSIYQYLFNEDDFKKELVEKITKTIYEDIHKLKDVYIYLAAKEMLLKEIPNENMLLIKKITDSIKNGGKTLNIITKDGGKLKVDNDFIDRNYFQSTVGFKRTFVEDIETILFGKNILFQK